MGQMTQTEMETELKGALGNRQDLNARLYHFLNLAQVRICRKHDWREMSTITEGSLPFTGTKTDDRFLALPTNMRSLYSFLLVDPDSMSDSFELQLIQLNVWNKFISATDAYSRGKTSSYTIWEKKFEFWRIPDKAYLYEIRHTLWPTEFTNGGGLVSDLDRKDDMIIALGASWAFLTLREMDEANRWWGIYKNMINDHIGLEVERPALDIKPAFETFKGGNSDYWTDPFRSASP